MYRTVFFNRPINLNLLLANACAQNEGYGAKPGAARCRLLVMVTTGTVHMAVLDLHVFGFANTHDFDIEI